MTDRESYRALFIGDVHMSNKLPHARASEDGITDRLKDQVQMWDDLRKYKEGHGIDDVWILGDLFDRALVDAATLIATVRALVRLAAAGGTVRILPGNHDTDDPKASRFVVDAFDGMGRDGVVSVGSGDLIVKISDWMTVWLMPYAPVPENRKRLEVIAELVPGAPGSVLLMHNSIIGARHMGWTSDAGLGATEVCAGFDAVFSGHFHTAQEFGSCGRYLGAPFQFNFGDEGEERGFWDVTFRPPDAEFRPGEVNDPLEVERTLVPVVAPRFWTVPWDRLSTPGGGVPEGARGGDYVRIEVRATAAEFEALRLAVDRQIEILESRGLRASAHHDVVYHHDSRLESADGGAEVASPERLMAEYVERVGVVGDLDSAELLALGRELYVEVTK